MGYVDVLHGKYYEIESFDYNREYDKVLVKHDNRYRDVGYIVLKEPVTDVEITKPLIGQLGEREVLKSGTEVTLVGFGVNEEGWLGFKNETINYLGDSLNTEYNVAPAPDAKTGACRGDSGGPAYVKMPNGEWRVWGISSRGVEDCKGFSIYGLMDTSLCWVQNRTGFVIDERMICKTQDAARPYDENLWFEECQNPTTYEMKINFDILRRHFKAEDCDDLAAIIKKDKKERLPLLQLTNVWPYRALTRDSSISDLNKRQESTFYFNNISDISWVKNLRPFSILMLNNNSIEDIVVPENYNHPVAVDFSYNQIKKIPELTQANVEQLLLSHNLLTSFPLTMPHKLLLLFLDGNKISSITGIEKHAKITHFHCNNCNLSDISPLQSLSEKIKNLELSQNYIESLTALDNSKSLENLAIRNNQISDLSPIMNNLKLEKLDVSNNKLTDTLDFSQFKSLGFLKLANNKIRHIIFAEDGDFGGEVDLSNNSLKKIDFIPPKSINLRLANNDLSSIEFLKNHKEFFFLDLVGNTNLKDLSPIKDALKESGTVLLPYIPGVIDENNAVIKAAREKNKNIYFSQTYTVKDVFQELKTKFPELIGKDLSKDEAYFVLGFSTVVTYKILRNTNLVQSKDWLDDILHQTFDCKTTDTCTIRTTFPEDVDLVKYTYALENK